MKRLIVIALAGLSAGMLGLAEPAANFTAEGFTLPSEISRLGVDVRGVVKHVAVKRGDTIKTGQLLVQIDDSLEVAQLKAAQLRADVRLQIEEADARVRLAKIELDKVQKSFDNKVGTELELERAKAELEVAQSRAGQARQAGEIAAADVAAQQARVDKFALRSPIDGYVEEVIARQGENVDESRPVIVVVDVDPLYVEVRLVSTEIVETFEIGQEMDVRYVGGDWQKAKLIFKSRVADSKSGKLLFRLELPNPTERPAGQKVEVRLKKPDPVAQR